MADQIKNSTSYIITYSHDKVPYITAAYLYKRQDGVVNGKMVQKSFTEPLPDTDIIKLAKKLKVSYKPPDKQITLVVNKKLDKVESARWFTHNAGNDFSGKKAILKAAQPLLGSNIKVKIRKI